MKKFWTMCFNVLLYFGIFTGMFLGLLFLFNKIAAPILGINEQEAGQYGFIIFMVALVLIAIVYYFIFRARRENLFKVCNFTSVNWKALLAMLIGSYALVIMIESLIGIPSFAGAFPVIKGYVDGIGSMSISVLTFTVMFLSVFFEEIVFRGVMFNELRKALPLSIAVIIGALLYGVANIVIGMGTAMGIGAFISAIYYILAYIYTGSLWSAVFVQVVCMGGMMFTHHTGIQKALEALSQEFLIGISVVSFLLSILFFYALSRMSKNK